MLCYAAAMLGGGLLLHPSALEAATSAMEVMAVSARNAALLVQGAVRRAAARVAAGAAPAAHAGETEPRGAAATGDGHGRDEL